MAMDNARRQAIRDALAAELSRQGVKGVDAEALADSVERTIDAQVPTTEGKRPEDLNATNDD